MVASLRRAVAPLRGSRPWRYVVAVCLVLLTWLISAALRPLVEPNPFLFFFGAVALSAWFGGLEGGLVATALTVPVVNYAFIQPDSPLSATPAEVARLLGFAAIATLITALFEGRRRATRAAQAKGEQLRVTLSSIGDAVIVTDTTGAVTFLNPVAVSLTGWAPEQALGRQVAEVFRIINEETREPVESPVAQVLREGVVVGLANHTLLVARDGSERPIDDSGAPIRAADGALIGVVLVFRDISERARLYAAERQARAEAEAAVQLRDMFLSIASHELKTPLTSLLMQAQPLQRRMARDERLAPANRRGLEVIAEQANRLNRMISGLLDISRLQQGQLSIERAPFDLHALARRVIAELQPVSPAHPLTLVGPDAPLVVEGDELRLEQVIQNLLQNAIKYSPNGGPVELHIVPSAAAVELRVVDHGIGIPADALPRLFTRFYRAGNIDPRQFSGMGVGLYVVKEIVALHGGRVWAESVEGQGSTFIVVLPTVAERREALAPLC